MAALAWLQVKTGLGLELYELRLARLARIRGGLWFLGALGRWYGPLPLPALLAAGAQLLSAGPLFSGAASLSTQVLLANAGFRAVYIRLCVLGIGY